MGPLALEASRRWSTQAALRDFVFKRTVRELETVPRARKPVAPCPWVQGCAPFARCRRGGLRASGRLRPRRHATPRDVTSPDPESGGRGAVRVAPCTQYRRYSGYVLARSRAGSAVNVPQCTTERRYAVGVGCAGASDYCPTAHERDWATVDPGPDRPGAVAARAREHGASFLYARCKAWRWREETCGAYV